MIVAFDLDGTLADLTHRLHFIQRNPKDWDGFFAACSADKPIWPIINAVAALYLDGHAVQIWSGRSSAVRIDTEKWLLNHGIRFHLLKMRRAGDHRPDNEVKGEWLDSLSLDERPTLAFDDRNQVVEMWRSRGIICCQVAPGDF